MLDSIRLFIALSLLIVPICRSGLAWERVDRTHPECEARLQRLKAPRTNSARVDLLGEHFRTFSPLSLHPVDAWIHFSAQEIAKTMEILLDGRNGYFDSLIGFATYPDHVYFSDLNRRLPPTVLAKLQVFAGDMIRIFEMSRQRSPTRLSIGIRVTWNEAFTSVRQGRGGGSSIDGLHDHAGDLERGDPEDSIDFVWSLHGPGPLVEVRKGVITPMPQDQVVFFGRRVRHGSPDTMDHRLVVVGTIH